jgi:hypothetical protein
LFIAEDVRGPQTITVKADTFRSEMWIGANGSNMTFNLNAGTDPVAPRATLTGAIDLSSIQVPQGHVKIGIVGYSQTDDLGDPGNEIKTPNDANRCNGGTMAQPLPCNFTVEVRPGRVALLAGVYDYNTNGTPTNTDDTITLIRWAYRGGITVTAGVNQSGQDLTLVDVGNIGNVTVDFGSPPSGLQTVGALVGVDLGNDGVFQLPFVTPQSATLLAPKPAAFNATTYRLTAIATNGTDPATQQSVVLKRDVTGSTLAAGTWLPLPASPTITRTNASWTHLPESTVMSVEYEQGTANLLNVTSFDGTTSFDVPELVALPAGTVTVKLNAISAKDFDVTNFSLDEDEKKLDRVSGLTLTLN